MGDDYYNYELNHFAFEQLISEMWQLADDAQTFSTDAEWRSARARYEEIWEEAKEVGNVEGSRYRYEGRRSDEASGLWEELKTEREKFWDLWQDWNSGKRARSQAEREKARAAREAANAPIYRANIQQKELILQSARAAAANPDPFEADKALEGMLVQWKKVFMTGRRPDPLDDAFHQLRKAVKQRRDQHKAARRDERTERLAAKQAVVDRAKELVYEPDRKAAGREVNALFETLKGFKIRDKEDDGLWKAFKDVRSAIKSGPPPQRPAAPPQPPPPQAQSKVAVATPPPPSPPPVQKAAPISVPAATSAPPSRPVEPPKPVSPPPAALVRKPAPTFADAFPSSPSAQLRSVPPPSAPGRWTKLASAAVLAGALLVPDPWSRIAKIPDVRPAPPRRSQLPAAPPPLPSVEEILSAARTPQAAPPKPKAASAKVPPKPKPPPKPKTQDDDLDRYLDKFRSP